MSRILSRYTLSENNNRKRCQNDVQNAAIMVLSYYNLAPVRKGLLQAHRDRC